MRFQWLDMPSNYSKNQAPHRRREGLGRVQYGRKPPPFWMSASSYYILAAAGSIAVFFLLWGILHDGHEETPWIGAGLGASIVLGSAVFIREILLIRTRRRVREAERRLDESLSAFPASLLNTGEPKKITLEKNTAMIRRIKKKSEAAKVLGGLSDGHREVFDLCDDYLRMVAMEIPTVAVGSPRLAAFRHGKDVVRDYHRYHLMQWAEIEAKGLTQEARSRARIIDRLKDAQQAVDVVDFALRYYPNEPALVDSLDVLNDLVDSLKIQDLVDKAEKAFLKGNKKRARTLYADALYIIDRAGVDGEEASLAAERIRIELEKLDSALAPETQSED